jgi:hypothetical protein
MKKDPISKLTKLKRTGSTTQVGAHLPSKHEYLSLTPRTTLKKRTTLKVHYQSFKEAGAALFPYKYRVSPKG